MSWASVSSGSSQRAAKVTWRAQVIVPSGPAALAGAAGDPTRTAAVTAIIKTGISRRMVRMSPPSG
ncbi:MAG: hypothetical protein AUH81_10100 [Candidatus Rokubacteria bacterium 13_1_40CM_4_69_5]|nr:MAG: hypothetical protein AUH81_10100 [Candidatus Rokubacteria bacterium 13_1_40CM_4_69_5]